jgi:multidrug efflux pump subunit AcrA (membrane-fusion protein)
MRSKVLLIVLFAGLASFTACGEKQTRMESSRDAVAVSVIPAEHRSVPVVVEVPGTVQPRDRIGLASQINGFVREMRVRAGDRVKPGQILAILDARDASNQKAAAQSAVDEATAALDEARRGREAAVQMRAASQASLDLAEQTFNRFQALFNSKSVSPQEMDEVRTRRDAARAELASRGSMVAAAEDRVKQAEARVSQAEAQAGRADVLVSYTRITASSAGVVALRAADEGAAIFPGSPLLVIESTGRPQVLASIPTEQASVLRTGLELELRHSDTAAPLKGRIAEIVPQSDPGTHSIQFKVDLPADTSVVVGQYMKLEVPAGSRNALLIARSAVREKGQLTGVFVVEEGSRARFRLVKTIPYDTEQLEILSGVEPGEKIILRPDNRISDGTPVEIQS